MNFISWNNQKTHTFTWACMNNYTDKRCVKCGLKIVQTFYDEVFTFNNNENFSCDEYLIKNIVE